VNGLSLTSFSSELVCYMITVAYNLRHGYAFSTFGDTGAWLGWAWLGWVNTAICWAVGGAWLLSLPLQTQARAASMFRTELELGGCMAGA
jgi:hypothetical protein